MGPLRTTQGSKARKKADSPKSKGKNEEPTFIEESFLQMKLESLKPAPEEKSAVVDAQAWLAAVVDASEDAVMSKTLDGIILSWNKSAERLYGYTADEMIGLSVDRLMPEDRLDEFPMIMNRLRRGEHIQRYDTVRVRKDGSRVDVSVSISPVKDRHGNIIGASAMTRDIADEVRLKKEFHMSEVRYRSLVEQSPLSTQIMSPDGRTLRVNHAWEKLWGVTADQIKDYNMLKDQQLVEKGVMPYIKRGFAGEALEIPPILYNVEETVPGISTLHDPERWVRAFIYPLKNDDGSVREIVLVHDDITEQKKAELQISIQHLVTRILAEAGSVDETVNDLLDTIGTVMGWDTGMFWRVDERSHVLRCISVWRAPGKSYPQFEALSRSITLAKGIGLPGLVWETRAPAWIIDVVESSNFPRYPVAKKEGLHAGFGFPILSGNETVGILEFFSRSKRKPNENVISTVMTLGSQLGQFIERKQDQEALREREAQLNLITNAVPVLISYIDANERYLFTNAAHQNWYGRDMTGRTVREALGEANYRLAQDFIRRALEGEHVFYDREMEHGGEMRVVHATYIPRIGRSGTVEGFISLVSDITERKRGEQSIQRENEELELRVSERTRQLQETNQELQREIVRRRLLEEKEQANLQRLKDMINNMPTAAVAGDENLTILHANELFCDLFKLGSVDDVINRNGADIIPLAKRVFEDPDRTEAGLMNILAEKKRVLNQELRLKDGRTLSCDYIPIFDKDVHRGHLLLYRDVTQEKRIDEAKTEFMSLASHQLRTPLTSVRWSLNRISKSLEGKMTENEAKLLGTARASILRMIDTVSTMLMISSIEAGKIHLNVTDVQLLRILTTLKNEFRMQYERKQQQLSVDCAEDLLLRTDPSFLKEILSNLLSNAIKYTPDGGSIGFRAKRDERRVILEIQDTGCGIPLKDHERIFTKFFRAENVLEKEPDGTGLGLYLVYALVTFLGGSISFSSQENRGTTFTLSFPSFLFSTHG
jgi:PAS domain S-box-containing protein